MRSSYIRQQFHEWGQKGLTRGPKDIVVGKGVLGGRMVVGCRRLGSMVLDGMEDHTTLHGLVLHGLVLHGLLALLFLLFLHDLFFLHDLQDLHDLHDLLFLHVLDLILKEKKIIVKNHRYTGLVLQEQLDANITVVIK